MCTGVFCAEVVVPALFVSPPVLVGRFAQGSLPPVQYRYAYRSHKGLTIHVLSRSHRSLPRVLGSMRTVIVHCRG